MIGTEFKSVIELLKHFHSEEVCIKYLEKLRWDGCVISPFDENSSVYKCSGFRYKCRNTNRYFNAKTSTMFDNTKIKLQTWYLAIYLVTTHKKGISSAQLARDLAVTQKTAWFMLHRIRNCFGITPEGNEMIGGEGHEVSLDETFVGGKNKNRHADKKVKNSQGRSFKDKTPVFGSLQHEVKSFNEREHKIVKGKTVKEKIVHIPSKVRCLVVADTKEKTLNPVIKTFVESGSKVISDEWMGYKGVKEDYEHHVVDHGRKQYTSEAGYTTNPIEGFWAIFKRAYIGVYHFMSRKHLQRYVDEVAFRYNNRHISDCERFNMLLRNVNKRTTYKSLIAS